uniref:Battenin n=1 Tax=Magallana gigas TaxID=29159 RepID=K1PV41_MAGGI
MEHSLRNWIGLFLLGSINNLPYVIVTSAAKTIADSFGKKNDVGLVFGANVALSVIVKGLIGVAFAFDFWFALVCIVVVGSSAAFGENVALGYLRLFPSKCVNAWSSGTGMAGVLGSAIYIIFAMWSMGFLMKQSPLKQHRGTKSGSKLTFDSKNLQLCAVYLFEYVAQGCASKVRPASEYNKGCPELFAALSFCYQAGVFVSRSSVQLFQIKRVEVLSVLQFLNMVLWIFDVHYKFIPVYLLPALMIYVGLLGGASYVNIFYLLLHEDKYPEEDREFCINIVSLFITGGIVLGTALETVLFNTVLESD